jgi:hypothetical protein
MQNMPRVSEILDPHPQRLRVELEGEAVELVLPDTANRDDVLAVAELAFAARPHPPRLDRFRERARVRILD